FVIHVISTSACYPLSLHDALPILSMFAGSKCIAKSWIFLKRSGTALDSGNSDPFDADVVLSSSGRMIVGSITVARDRPVPYNAQDRKSTRLNSSHVKISYAVFCLK